MWQLLQVSCLLCLAQAGHVLQRIRDDGLQREIPPELPVYQKEVDTPFILQKESVLAPRGIRPKARCRGRLPCDIFVPPFDHLVHFPPGRPTENNIDNICEESRVKSRYGEHNLPQSGFGHLTRQGNAINQMEEGYTKCCLQSEKLGCAQDLWRDVLHQFCTDEFSVKTSPYLCCKEEDLPRYSCFEEQAPDPSYSSLIPNMENVDIPILSYVSIPGSCTSDDTMSISKCQRRKLREIAFPPGEPKVDSMENICRLKKFRPTYPKDALPRSSFGWLHRQAKVINQLEAQYKRCCKNEDVACAHDAWEKVLDQFCKEEFSVKTKPHECCNEESSTAIYTCFSSRAPHPNYDREIQMLNLGNLHEPVLQQLCGDMKLLSKQKQIPLLVKDITTCCGVPSSDRTACAEQKREEFVETLCTTNKGSWKDTQNCCDQEDRISCFSNNYLDKVSIAIASTDFGDN